MKVQAYGVAFPRSHFQKNYILTENREFLYKTPPLKVSDLVEISTSSKQHY